MPKCEYDGCRAEIVFVRDSQTNRWKVYDAGSKPAPEAEHWRTCKGDEALRRRIRNGMEPGIFPCSPSRLKLYEKCALAYHRRYVQRIHEPENDEGILGTSLHERQAAILRGEPPPTPRIPLRLATDWTYLCRVMDRLEWDTTGGVAVEDRQTYSWQDGAIRVDYEVKLDFWRWGDTPYDVLVVDFKSGRTDLLPEEAQIQNWDVPGASALAKDVQAWSYPLVLYRTFPQIQRVRFQQVQLRHGGIVVAVEFTADQLEELDKVLRAKVSELIRDTDFEANPYCSVCPVGVHPITSYPVTVSGKGGQITLRRPESAEEAQRLAEFTLAARRVAGAGSKALQDWVRVHGPVGGWGFYPKTTREAPAAVDVKVGEGDDATTETITGIERVIELCFEHDMGWLVAELVGYRGKKLSTLLEAVARNKQAFVQALRDEGLILEETSTAFDWRDPSSESYQAALWPEPAEALPVA